MRSCGSCKHFHKLKNDMFSGGMCQKLDGRTNTDSGTKCEYWKGIKYNRIQVKNK